MNPNEYQQLCRRTANEKGEEREIFNWGLGIVGEAGDVAGCIKKLHMHNNKSMKEGIKENLGDTLWYIAMICNFYGWDLEDVL